MGDSGSYELFRGILPPYGYIIVSVFPKRETGIITTAIVAGGKTSLGMHNIRQVVVSKKEAKLVASALKSQGGELTAADFYPEEVAKIMRRVPRETHATNSR